MKNKINVLIIIIGLAIGIIGAKLGISIAIGATMIVILAAAIILDYQKTVILLGIYVFIDFAVRNLAGLAVFSSIWDELMFLGFICIFIYKLIRYRNKSIYKSTPLDFPIVFFVLMGILLVFINSPNLGIAIDGLRAVVQYMLWYFLAVQLLDSTKSILKVYWVLTSVGTLLGLHGIYQYLTGAEMLGNWVDSAENITTRAYSIVGSPNILGAVFVLFIPMSIALLTSDHNRWRKFIAFCMTVVMAGGLFATMSRGAWISAAFGIGIFIIYKNKKLLLPLILCGGIALLMVPSLSNRLTYMFTDEYKAKSSRGGRIYRWEEGIEAWSEGNKVIGLGLGRYGGAVATNNDLSPFYMDNYYLKTLAEMGILGLVSFILLLICVVKWCTTAVIEERDRRKKDLMMGLFAGALGMLAQNGVENIFEVPMMVTYFWLCIGMIMALKLDKNRYSIRDNIMK
ncbi:O-antigen ligase family protein [Vallitalea sp.]|uniref:O-antigen ligase family protein n=1 Tax=Vallitalea sp. TaxID=1882829 RepID=UPI0025F0E459|nr:O-antigen ligase family protein [Vallitalea sp.]MCT4688607.1 O-antigen ligase family protein [Vallitalea sp.]